MVLITVSGRKEVIMATVPLRYSNRLGFPMLEVKSVQDATLPATTTYFKFNDHPQRRMNFYGAFFVKVPNLSTYTDTNTVVFKTEDIEASEKTLYLYDGSAATIEDVMTTGGIMLCFYDSTTGKLQLVNAF